MGWFIDTVRNMNNEQCVNAVVHEVAILLPANALKEKSGVMISAILRSGPLQKSEIDFRNWSLKICNIKISKLSENYNGYFERATPNLMFLKC